MDEVLDVSGAAGDGEGAGGGGRGVGGEVGRGGDLVAGAGADAAPVLVPLCSHP